MMNNKQMTSFTEENYLKAIFHLCENKNGLAVSTNELAEITQTRAASVSDMLRRLSEKELILYKKYQGVTLTEEGKSIALKIIRKHRLWEVFLVEKLGFGWDEIHEIAEELEHIDSKVLTERLDNFLGNPKFDPHGDPIPDEKGNMPSQVSFKLSEAAINTELVMLGVSEDSAPFLQHLDKLSLHLGAKLRVLDVSGYDQSLHIEINKAGTIHISKEVACSILVSKK